MGLWKMLFAPADRRLAAIEEAQRETLRRMGGPALLARLAREDERLLREERVRDWQLAQAERRIEAEEAEIQATADEAAAVAEAVAAERRRRELPSI